MKFVSSREVKRNPAVLWKSDKVVVTVNGKPKALVLKVSDYDIEEIMNLLNRVKAQLALEKLRMYSLEKGLDSMSEDEINTLVEEIRENESGT